MIDQDTILKLDRLSMHFGGLKAVDELSFSVKKGEIFGLIGPNGAGKTTVFNCITRFYKATSGQIFYRNRLNEPLNLNQFVVHNVIKEGIVRTFQNVELIWELPILENLLVAGHTLYRTGFFGQLFNIRRIRREEMIMRQKALKILSDLDLLAYQYAYPIGLPYGILKKIELARTLMVNPQLIILDEPAAGLNDAETDNLALTIKKIRDEYQATIFLVEHDMGLVMEICDTVCAISFGKKLAIGTPKEIQSSQIVREAYLGGE
ncbi:MAG: ABC transporter ATP-binding protein [Tenericutes bacterium HGW-Tenericutes-2]|nr:MAG: ABC transporter ATP-binding protein [Tenericutes bacterium HGW-Tenericutes-3]PKK97839.1 MAG: ABC transporter ATP-binding protein [Tenericutes bacterium HGW-Tenericutes-2]PKL00618.1 MAG: ABC transporter ATP-binding protein [Tenericutes bacterium HGW-Tenericutes-1]